MKPRNKLRLFLIGDLIEGTGFNRVVHHFKDAAKPYFELHHLGLGYQGERFKTDDGVRVYPDLYGAGGYGGYKEIGKLLEEIDPDILFVIYDFVYIRFVLEALRYRLRPIKVGIYLALDGIIQKHRKMLSPLKAADVIIFYTDFAFKQVQDILFQQPSLLHRNISLGTIPHGVETNLFYPLSGDFLDRSQAKRLLFKDLVDPDDSFVVFNGNRPVVRKQLGITIKAFAEFAKNKGPNVKLYLHFLPDKELHYCYLHELIEKLDIEDRVISRRKIGFSQLVDDHTLNLIYNACDIGINTAMGEGWGLVSCEHAATGAAQIVPNHTAFTEIWSDAALFVEPVGGLNVRFSSHLMYELSAIDFAIALEQLYTDHELRHQLATAGYNRMQSEKYNWDTIIDQWHELFLVLKKSSNLFHHSPNQQGIF